VVLDAGVPDREHLGRQAAFSACAPKAPSTTAASAARPPAARKSFAPVVIAILRDKIANPSNPRYKHVAQIVIPSVARLKEWVGREVAVTDWFTVSQERIDAFAGATEDDQWIHVDRKRAAEESPYGTTVAHGFLTLSSCRT